MQQIAMQHHAKAIHDMTTGGTYFCPVGSIRHFECQNYPGLLKLEDTVLHWSSLTVLAHGFSYT